jgi:glycosyltransferase involved in cell wall biosynthesis
MGTADVLSDMKGATVAPEDEAEFARLTADLLNNPQKRAALSHLAEKDANTWSSRRFAQRLLDLYASLCAEPQKNSEAA